MRKIIKIGFPILCVSVIIGTFILLNKTTDRINRNKLNENKIKVINVENTVSNSTDEYVEPLDSDQIKAQEVKNKAKAIELVKKLAPPDSEAYYTNEGTDKEKYIVAIRDKSTKNVKIYYLVDINREKIEIYIK